MQVFVVTASCEPCGLHIAAVAFQEVQLPEGGPPCLDCGSEMSVVAEWKESDEIIPEGCVPVHVGVYGGE